MSAPASTAPRRSRRATAFTAAAPITLSRAEEYAYIRADLRRLYIVGGLLLLLMLVILVIVGR